MYFLLSGIFVFGADNPSENKSQTNRNSKKRFLPSLNKKKQKLYHARIALINRRFRGLLKGWCAEDIWCNWFPCLSAATHIWSYSFFTPNNVWLCLSVFINTERHFNTRHLDYRAATPYKYCSDCYGEFINVILGGWHYSVWHATLSFYRIWIIILSTQ